MGGTSESDSNSSSGEEDGDVEWRKAIDSVAATTSSYVSSAISSAANHSSTPAVDGDDGRSHKPKHYQIKAQKILDEILEKTLVMVKEDPIYAPDIDALSDGGEGSEPMSNGGGIRLFKNSTPGIVLDHIDEPQQPRKRPKILPGKEIDEKSKKFKKRLQSVAVGGEDIMAAARDASRKSVERLQSKEIAAKEAVSFPSEEANSLPAPSTFLTLLRPRRREPQPQGRTILTKYRVKKNFQSAITPARPDEAQWPTSVDMSRRRWGAHLESPLLSFAVSGAIA